MTDDLTPDLASLDRAAAAAAAGLHRHVDQHLDVERGLATLPAAPSPRRTRSRVLAVAAAVAVMVGMVAVVGQDHDGPSHLDVDEDGNPLPPPEPGVLAPLAPDDGKDSIQLPVTIEPSTGLRDGRTVQASGTGFVPGEQVGIVQCAIEAGGETPETRGGVDGCDIASVVYADADETGAATGAIRLRRVLTTPLTGTVDCAAEADRCIVAIGAIADYDRSGGVGFTLAGGGEPIDIPTLSASPVEGLADQDVVQLVGDGYDRSALLDASVCATQTSTCWTARPAQIDHGRLPTSSDGRLKADVIVPRFLPGTTAGTYVDCAVSACTLRIAGGRTAPPPVPLTFVDDGAVPLPPGITVEPASGLAFGDRVVVRGAGFAPGEEVTLSLCAKAPGTDDGWPVCAGADDGILDVDEEGAFATEIELPSLSGLTPADGMTTTSCVGDCPSEPSPPVLDLSCDGVRSACSIVVESWSEESAPYGPRFQPVPVPLTFG